MFRHPLRTVENQTSGAGFGSFWLMSHLPAHSSNQRDRWTKLRCLRRSSCPLVTGYGDAEFTTKAVDALDLAECRSR